MNEYIDRDKLFDSLVESTFIMFPRLTSEEKREKTENMFLKMEKKLCKPEGSFIGGCETVIKIIEDMDGEEDIFSKDQDRLWKWLMRCKQKGRGWLMSEHMKYEGLQ